MLYGTSCYYILCCKTTDCTLTFAKQYSEGVLPGGTRHRPPVPIHPFEKQSKVWPATKNTWSACSFVIRTSSEQYLVSDRYHWTCCLHLPSASRRLKSQETELFVQELMKLNIKENINFPYHCLCKGIHRWPVGSPYRRPVMRKTFHVMTSSCSNNFLKCWI